MHCGLPSSIAGFALLTACASNGTRPADMTAAEHETAARASQSAAAAHAEQFDPNARGAHCKYFDIRDLRCRPYWTSEVNPTKRHLREAKEHEELAARHRGASAALRQAEERACAGLAEPDRDVSPFYHREDIDRVERIHSEAIKRGGVSLGHIAPMGARVVFRARPGMTAEWLQRVVDCHIARWQALGAQDLQTAYCPLALPGVRGNVVPVRGGFAVEVVAPDDATARAVIDRAEALLKQP